MNSYLIEEESGTIVRSSQPTTRAHEGYYAGQMATSSPRELAAWFAWGRTATTYAAA